MKLPNLGTAFYFLLASFSLNGLAAHIVRFGISWFILEKSGSATLFATILAATAFVESYSKPFVAPLADYFDRYLTYRNSIAVTTSLSATLFVVSAALPFSVPVLVTLLVAQSIVSALREPAGAALVPALVKPDDLTAAQSMRASASSLVTIAGPVLGALMLTAVGSRGAVGLGAAICVISLCNIAAAQKRVISPAQGQPAQWRQYLRTWHVRTAEGLRAVWAVPTERKTCIATALLNCSVFPMMTLVLPVWAATTLGGSPSTMAIIEVSLGAGLLTTSTFLLPKVNDFLGRYRTVLLGITLTSCALLAASLATSLAVIIPLFFAVGAGVVFYNVNVTTVRSVATPAAFRARMTAGVSFLSCCLHPFVTKPFGVVLDVAGAPAAVAICGVFGLLGTLVMLTNRGAKPLLNRNNKDLIDTYANLHPRAFGSLARA